MRTPDYTGQFKRDFRKVESRGKDMRKVEEAMFLLLSAFAGTVQRPCAERFLAALPGIAHCAGLAACL
jgi:hypothetical protein